MPLDPRDRRSLLWGAPVIVLLLGYLLFKGSGDRPRPPASAPVEIAPAMALPAPVVAAPQPVAVAVSVAPAADLSQFRLVGILSRGVILAGPDGQQRNVPIGREIAPGISLRRVEVHAAVFTTSGGEVRLGFDGVAPATATAPVAAAGLQTDDSARYRLGLGPRALAGRIQGYVVRPGADLPALARIGIRPGDIITMVNGAPLDERGIEALAGQMARGDRVEFQVERFGQTIRMSAPAGG